MEEIFIRFNSSNNLLEFLENLDIEESKIRDGIKERMNEDFVRLKFPFQTPIPRPALISTSISSFLVNSPQQCNNHT
jgi:protein involved in ribonucleotide reduction